MFPLTPRAEPVAESRVVPGFRLFEGEDARDAAEEVDTMRIEEKHSPAVGEHSESGRASPL